MSDKPNLVVRALRGRNKYWSLPAVLIGLPLFTWGGVEATSVPAFCNVCHEIGPVVASWQKSEHAPRDGKQRADCRDCHIPSWSHPFDTVFVKLRHGVVDTYVKSTSEPDAEFYYRLKYKTLATTTNEDCLSCHQQVLTPEDVIKTDEGEIRGLHISDEVKKLPCVMCHRGTGHNPYE